MRGVNFKSADLIMGAPPGQEGEIFGLPVQRVMEGAQHIGWRSLWLPDDYDRKAIAGGALIDLRILSVSHPPVSINLAGLNELVVND